MLDDAELRPLIDEFLHGANDVDAERRAAIYRLAWDFIGSGLGFTQRAVRAQLPRVGQDQPHASTTMAVRRSHGAVRARRRDAASCRRDPRRADRPRDPGLGSAAQRRPRGRSPACCPTTSSVSIPPGSPIVPSTPGSWPAVRPWRPYELHEARMMSVSDDDVLLVLPGRLATGRCRAATACRSRCTCSSLWCRRPEGWVNVFSQDTPVETG